MSLSIADQQGYLHGVRVVELADELGEYCGKVLAGLTKRIDGAMLGLAIADAASLEQSLQALQGA